MKLAQYLERESLRKKDFAAQIGVHPSLISLLVHGRRKPTFDQLTRITEATKGRVTLKDFAEDGQ